MKAFKKGELVTYIANWDGKGTFYFIHAVVYSCGNKQMVLTSEETGREMGRTYAPELATIETRDRHTNGYNGTYLRMTDEEAHAACIEVAGRFLVSERARLDACKANNGHHEGYSASIDRTIAMLHEPTARKEA